MSSNPMFHKGQKFVVEIAEIYTSVTKDGVAGRRSEDYVYRMKGAIPLMREGQLKLLERIDDGNQSNA